MTEQPKSIKPLNMNTSINDQRLLITAKTRHSGIIAWEKLLLKYENIRYILGCYFLRKS